MSFNHQMIYTEQQSAGQSLKKKGAALAAPFFKGKNQSVVYSNAVTSISTVVVS